MKVGLFFYFFGMINIYYALGLERSDGIVYLYPKDRPIKIDPQKLGYCLAKITIDNYPYFNFSEKEIKCKWFPNIAKKDQKIENYPGQIEYLQASRLRKCDYITGHEESLKSWILNQPDNSVDIVRLYSKALELNHGNIKGAFTTIHTSLRDNARFSNGTERRRGRYYYKTNPEDVRVLFNKLIDIRGDLLELGEKYNGDHKGTWYRIWGVMLGRLIFYNNNTLSFSKSRNSCPVNPFSFLDKIANSVSSSISRMGIYATEVVAKTGNENDKYKVSVSQQYSQALEYLIKGLAKNSEVKNINEKNCTPEHYLIPR